MPDHTMDDFDYWVAHCTIDEFEDWLTNRFINAPRPVHSFSDEPQAHSEAPWESQEQTRMALIQPHIQPQVYSEAPWQNQEQTRAVVIHGEASVMLAKEDTSPPSALTVLLPEEVPTTSIVEKTFSLLNRL